MFGSWEPNVETPDPALARWIQQKLAAIDVARLRSDTQRLLGPHERRTSLDRMVVAEQQIVESFRNAGWPVERWPYRLENVHGWTDAPYGAERPTVFPRLEGTNLLAIQPGRLDREAVVIVAHYDTVTGLPGADDNVASVAALLELARILARDRFQRTVILAATDMEELLYVGARQLVDELRRRYRVAGAIVFETMSYTTQEPHTLALESRPGFLYRPQRKRMAQYEWAGRFTLVLYRGSATPLAVAFASAMKAADAPDSAVLFRDPGNLRLIGPILRRIAPGLVRHFYRSDHVPFWRARIPAIMVTDGANFCNPNYHQPSDLPETLDYRRLAAIVASAAGALGRVAELEMPSDSFCPASHLSATARGAA